MRPLVELPEVRLPHGLAFDIDDTVTLERTADGKKPVDPRSIEAMHALKAAGFFLVAATGRPLGWAEEETRDWPVDLVVGENGAGWFWYEDSGEITRGFSVNDSDRARIHTAYDAIRAEVLQKLPWIKEARDSPQRKLDLSFDVAEFEQVNAEDRRRLTDIIESCGALAVTSSVHCHAQLGTWSKASAIVAGVTARFGSFDKSVWTFVGDSGNDAPAFEFFERSVGVANVRECELEQWPAFVTQGNRSDGFVELVAHLLGAGA